MLNIAVVNKSSVPFDQFNRMVSAVATQVKRDFSPVWGLNARLFVPLKGDEERPRAWSLFVYDNREQVPGYVETPDPNVAVFVEESSSGGLHWTVTASQAILETLADPWCNCAQTTSEGFLGLDVCAPVSSDAHAYKVNGVFVSDFVLPNWYVSGSMGPWSFKKNAPAPLTVAEGGHRVRWNEDSSVWEVEGEPRLPSWRAALRNSS